MLITQENYRLGGSFQWPSVEEVMEYRRQVYHTILSVIDNAPFDLPVTVDHPWVCNSLILYNFCDNCEHFFAVVCVYGD